MSRHFDGPRLLIASHNPGKCAELEELLGSHVAELVRASALGLPVPEETADSFAGNACLKAVSSARLSGMPALADDCGLCIAALDGAPGVLSARWGGERREFPVAIERLRRALGDSRSDAATFHCALALAWPDGGCEIAEGVLHGRVTFPPRGTLGNGYDPIFIPDGMSQTLGELTPAERNAINHRALAWKQLRARCFT